MGFEPLKPLSQNLLPLPIVKGKVIDEKGNPLPGATVLAKGTTKAVLTNADGDFTIDMPANSTKLVVSYIGMESLEVTIKSTPLTIILKELGQELSEVIITTGYEKTSKELLQER
jgi:predicted SpoU family rRNA methylase